MGNQRKKKNYKAVGPYLRKLLWVIFGLFALLVVNSVYLVSITVAGPEYQNWFYLNMFLLHLILGLLIVVPVIAFGIGHIRNTRNRKNRRAVRVGYALFSVAIILFLSGVMLTRVDLPGFRLDLQHPATRSIAYWVHVLAPVAAVWLFVIHRLVGPKIRWRVGATWAGVAAVFAIGMVIWQRQDPRAWNREGPESGAQYFEPSLARTSSGDFIPAGTMQNDAYCKECHHEVHETWSDSAHKFSSFNNPVYAFSVKETRAVLMERDGNVRASRFCAGCHDPVPFFSGAFDDPKFDDPDYDLSKDPMAQAGITCTACHAISHVNSVRGNADYTIDEPMHYPFFDSKNETLAWLNRQLIKAKPEFHKATFLKPLHREPEFCGSCHKVHLPEELNNYKWLRGQNHFDSFWLSGVSGQGIASFYYPEKAEENCNGCHMPAVPLGPEVNFAASVVEDGVTKTLDHTFLSANTAMPHLLPDQFRDPEAVIAAHQAFNEGVMRVDLFGIKEGGAIDDPLMAPLRPVIPALKTGEAYLMEVVVRTLKMGHLFTQGTADSNQVWLDVVVRGDQGILGRSGGMDAAGRVDPWAHFVNSFVIDREGNRIDRRNAQDIFVSLYNHQIPPGAADVIHYALKVPAGYRGSVTVEATLRYRKFDSTLMQHVTGDEAYVNDLPVMTLAHDTITLQVGSAQEVDDVDFPLWQRWNDYGIALLRKGQLGELRQAAEAFARVEALGRPDGPLNLARLYIKEGLVQTEAPRALQRADKLGANQWSLLWFGAEVAQRNGDYARAITNLKEIMRGGFTQAVGRGFDFSKDYRVLNALGNALYQTALGLMDAERDKVMQEALEAYEQALAYDPENLSAHWGLHRIHKDRGNVETAKKHAELHARYKPDDNARDKAVALARQKYPAANKAAEAVVIYDLHRPGAPLEDSPHDRP
ncbi:MAG: multiheme c-type cytochrome [Acidobacteriota bacterium]|nr:multiheme c-type cytochrome [Acidobacteriota bacterium]